MRVRVVPGCAFTARDAEFFHELSEIIAEGALTSLEAQAFALEVQRTLGASIHTKLLDSLVRRLPGLLPVQAAVGKNPVAQRRALIIMRTVLDALATVHRPSTPATPP